MAVPVSFEKANFRLLPPPGNEDSVGEMPVHQGTDFIEGVGMIPTLTSCWELTGEELSEVLRTGKIYLKCWGVSHPPVGISGIDPIPNQENYG